MSASALSHLRVIDLTHCVAGPYCTKLLAGFGAEVIKVERPETGDKLRTIGPFFEDKADPERSIPFLWLNTGKKSITLNLKKEKGVEIIQHLLRDADILVENFSPHVMPGLGLSYEKLCEINPNLIVTSISNFGRSGPYRDYKAEEIVEYALCGGMYLTGDPDKEPLNSGPAVCQYTAGMYAYIASLMAIFQRETSEGSQHIDVSIQDCALGNLEISLVNYLQGENSIPKRSGDRHPMVPWELYDCKDGSISLIGGPVRHWLNAADFFQEPELFQKKFYHIADRIENREDFEKLLRPRVQQFEKMDLFALGQNNKLAFGYLATPDDVLTSPQHRERRFFEAVDHPEVGRHRYCGAPYKLSETPWQTVRAPLLGEHNQVVYGDQLGFCGQDFESLKKEGII
ncbi:MAG: CaiB/BaiF CoA transferase family protein [Planctomycetota bacterium]|jgi:crotonobetainyl-CoA:carnitine CoA-transferase CaiB-like acyl-CoA transferase